MFDWLFEGRLSIYLALGVIVAILVGLWVRDRRRVWWIGVALVVCLGLVYFLLDRFVETGREQIARKLQDMAVAVKARNVDQIFRHLSERFSLQGMNKRDFRAFVDTVMRDGGVTELEIWNVLVTDDQGSVSLMAKPKGRLPGTDAFYLVRAKFVRESGNEWRMESFQVFNPYANSTTPLDIPRFSR